MYRFNRKIQGHSISIIVKAALVVLICASVSIIKAQGYLKTDGKKIINEKGENVLLRGMGLGGWMLQEGYMLRVNKDGQQHKVRERIEALVGPEKTKAFYQAWLANHTRKIDIDSMKSWGFNSVRLPMHYNLYTLPVEAEPKKGENTWLSEGFTLTDSLLAWCKANKMYLILDMHAAPGGQGNDLNISDADTAQPALWESEANKQKMIALWRKLAQRYAHEPWIGGYDIINEPNWGFTDPVKDKNGTGEKDNAQLKQLMQDITKAIREVDQRHIIIIEGNGWGNNYNGILPPWDKNMVLSFHKYWNKNDTASISHILKAREQYNVPVWVGETGENSNVWFTQAIRLLERNNIGWAWWPLKKMGFNNPLEIKTTDGYNQVLAYWSGRGAKPSADIAYTGLMQLAANAKLENAIYHKDVVDAMFRQPFSATAIPYKQHTIPGIIAAVDYDLGPNGVAYLDMDTADYRVAGQRGAGNRGRTYRNDGVDISRDSLDKNSYYVSDVEKGEWLQYTLSVAKAGTYSLRVLTAGKGNLEVQLNNSKVGEAITNSSPSTNEKWQMQEFKNIALPAGIQVIRVLITEGTPELKSLQWEAK